MVSFQTAFIHPSEIINSLLQIINMKDYQPYISDAKIRGAQYLFSMTEEEYFNGNGQSSYTRGDTLRQRSAQVTKLIIHQTPMPILTLMADISDQAWPLLTTLILKNDHLHNEACKVITRASMKNLRKLDLSKNQIQNEGFGHLSKGRWRNLEELLLSQNRQTSVLDLSKFARGNWPALRLLSLNEDFPQLEQAASLYLIESPRINSLSIDHLRPPNYNIERIRQALRQRFTQARIT